MKKLKIKKIQNNNFDKDWKEKNAQYLRELQIFFDKVDSIKDLELRKSVTSQMLICDKVLTEIAEDMFINFYNKGYEEAKNG